MKSWFKHTLGIHLPMPAADQPVTQALPEVFKRCTSFKSAAPPCWAHFDGDRVADRSRPVTLRPAPGSGCWEAQRPRLRPGAFRFFNIFVRLSRVVGVDAGLHVGSASSCGAGAFGEGCGLLGLGSCHRSPRTHRSPGALTGSCHRSPRTLHGLLPCSTRLPRGSV